MTEQGEGSGGGGDRRIRPTEYLAPLLAVALALLAGWWLVTRRQERDRQRPAPAPAPLEFRLPPGEDGRRGG